MLYNVLQVCHGGHLLRVLYVRVKTLTNREWEDAKKCRLGGGRMGAGKETAHQAHGLSIYLALI